MQELTFVGGWKSATYKYNMLSHQGYQVMLPCVTMTTLITVVIVSIRESWSQVPPTYRPLTDITEIVVKSLPCHYWQEFWQPLFFSCIFSYEKVIIMTMLFSWLSLSTLMLIS